MNQPSVNNLLPRLQHWYHSQCDGTWEHASGVLIETLDNPGWSVEVDLRGTKLARRPFAPINRLAPTKGPATEWLVCSVTDGQFQAFGGPDKLAEMIAIFLNWADEKPAAATL
jgi:hypothetical protein